MSKEKNSRRKFMKKAAYVAPAVLILGGLNSHASEHASGSSQINIKCGNGNHFGDKNGGNGNHFGDKNGGNGNHFGDKNGGNGNHFGDKNDGNGNHFGDKNGNHFGRNN
jgi:hypothetical protein